MSRGDFWSRRKAAVDAEAQAQAELRAADALAAQEVAVDERSDEDILQDLGLPDPDSLGEGDDFRVFLTETVPARIRTRALRRLWISNPILANVDGLVDYGEDFTDASCVIENLQTAYQVGKGMTAHVEEMARQAEAELEGDEAEPSEEESEDALVSEQVALADDTDQTPQDTVETAPADYNLAVLGDPDEEDTPMPPRRMRFHFDEARPET